MLKDNDSRVRNCAANGLLNFIPLSFATVMPNIAQIFVNRYIVSGFMAPISNMLEFDDDFTILKTKISEYLYYMISRKQTPFGKILLFI